ncbi:MAG: cyclase family protein [Bacillota bacterium]|nr:cyclase family protein [Bacillota bacterium]
MDTDYADNGKYRVVDLSHPIWPPGMPMFPGLPGPVVAEHLGRTDSEAHYGPGTSFLISRVELVGNTGTHIDSPLHRYSGGKDVSDLPLAGLVSLPGIVVEPSIRAGRLALDGPDSMVSP